MSDFRTVIKGLSPRGIESSIFHFLALFSAGLLLLGAGETASSAKAQGCRACAPAAGCVSPDCARPGDGSDAEAAAPGYGEGDGEGDLADAMDTPSPDLLASSYGPASGPQSIAPNMIGDFFGGRSGRSQIVRTFTFDHLSIDMVPFIYTWVASPSTGVPSGTPIAVTAADMGGPITAINDAAGGPDPQYQFQVPLDAVPDGGTFLGGTVMELPASYMAQFNVAYLVDIPNPGAGGVVGRTKIAENTSPLPRDRILLDYSFFENVPLTAGGVDVNRFTPGFEKTFCNGMASFEMKLPMAVTLDSTVVQDGGTELSHGEFGNMALTVKALLLQRRRWALSCGMTVTVPTADDTRLVLADGTDLVRIKNRSVHLAPFLGLLWTPNDRCYGQAFFQWDVDASGCPVYANPDLSGLHYAGKLSDTTFQFIDVGLGYWTYRSRSRNAWFQGMSVTGELHWNRSLRDMDVVEYGNFTVGDFSRGDVDLLNLTLGTHLECSNNTTITLAYSVPLGGGQDQQFDGEFRLLINRWFGASSRVARAPFAYQ